MKNRNKMYLRIAGFMLLLVMCYPVLSVGQTATVWKAVVKDGSTQKPLSNVLICVDRDTIGVRSNSAGEFQVSVKQNSSIFFRKQGYTWKKVDFERGMDKVELAASPLDAIKSSAEILAIYVDGKLLPKEEWNDINIDMIDRENGISSYYSFESNIISALYLTTKR